MVKVPYYDTFASETFFIFFDFRGNFPFDVPITFIMDTFEGPIHDGDLDDISDFYKLLNTSGSVIPCSSDDYDYVADLLCSWGCSC